MPDHDRWTAKPGGEQQELRLGAGLEIHIGATLNPPAHRAAPAAPCAAERSTLS
jgi:hypothetical protein